MTMFSSSKRMAMIMYSSPWVSVGRCTTSLNQASSRPNATTVNGLPIVAMILSHHKKSSDNPWYLYAGFIHPHPPFSPPNPWHKLYRGPEMPHPFLPDNIEELTCFINKYQNRYKYRDQGLDMQMIRCIKAYYYACISFIDHQVGRMLDTLEAQHDLDNTLIIFTSDHGELLGDYGCFGKRSFHEAAMRIPMLARLPEHFAANTTCESPVTLVDLMKTFTDVAGCRLQRTATGTPWSESLLKKPNAMRFTSTMAVAKIQFSAQSQKITNMPTAPLIKKSFYLQQGLSTSEKTLLRVTQSPSIPSCPHTGASALSELPQNCFDEEGNWKPHERLSLPDDPDAGLLYQDPAHTAVSLPEPFELEYPKNR